MRAGETIDVGQLVRKIPSQYPFVLVDRVLDHDPGSGLRALKSVTGSEEFFGGHFPGAPVMPGVLIMEGLAQAAGIWLLDQSKDPRLAEVHVVGIDDAKFRRPVVPGDRLELDVRVLQRRGELWRFRGEVLCDEQRVAEARLLLRLVEQPQPDVHPLARVEVGASLGPGVRVGPYCIVGPDVRLGAGSILESHVVIGGCTDIGQGNHVFPFAAIGMPPQDLKYHGERTRLSIGDRNVIREYVTMNPGTATGGGLTRVGSDNLFMAHAHVAHDCSVGDRTIFANGATLAGHVEVGSGAIIGAYSAVHQFCRVGVQAFLGGYTVATKDVLPFSRTVGSRPACLFGMNRVGLERQGLPPERLKALRGAFRVLMQGRLNASDALSRLEEQGPHTPEVAQLVEFVRGSRRGVILRRRNPRRHESAEA